MRAELHVGVDAEKVVVSPYALRMSSGRARAHRFGSVTEMVPLAPSGRGREQRIAYVARLSLPLIFLTAVLFAAGVPWWLPAAVSAGAIVLVWRRMARAARPGVFAVPADDLSRVIRATPERVAFERAVSVSRRIRRTWPELPGMIDPVPADRSLTRALEELAGLLSHRQEIRRLREELSEVRTNDLPAGSSAVLALTAQRDRVEELWLATAEPVNRILRSLDTAALAGETFLREQGVGAAARAAEQMLATLGGGAGGPAGSGPELADRTEAVLSAYRELEIIPAAAGQN